MRWLKILMLAPGLLLGAQALGAATDGGTVILDETVISGNQELPKVLYILPWREVDGIPVPASAPDLSQDYVLRPVYPHEYRQRMAYRRLLEDESKED
ncbi:MAG: hypothetical protein O7G84_12865 [Gammaproteobacteria bacterium]|nr:hypothetical protein [Gammaproteobacteria bacterium]